MEGAVDALVNDSKDSIWVKTYETSVDKVGRNQFVFFLKPETTDFNNGVNTQEIVKMVQEKLTESKIEVGAIRVLRGPYLAAKNIMGEHYGVISEISKNGEGAISDEAKHSLIQLLQSPEYEEYANATILGAHQFLDEYPEMNPYGLRVLQDNLGGGSKLAGGTYVLKLSVLGKKFLLLNAFHPFQLVPYYKDENAIIIVEGITDIPWSELRDSVCGDTDPSKAPKGSIRSELLQNMTQFGLTSCTKSSNGCHMSAGPLEGMVEVQRFFSEGKSLTWDQTAFGALLAQEGLDAETIDTFAQNPDITRNESTRSTFDHTEKLSSRDAARLLASTE